MQNVWNVDRILFLDRKTPQNERKYILLKDSKLSYRAWDKSSSTDDPYQKRATFDRKAVERPASWTEK